MKTDKIARKIVQGVQFRVKELVTPLSFGVNLLEPCAVDTCDIVFATDAKNLFYNPENILQIYRKGRTSELEYHLIHIVMHGILGHFADCAYLQKKLAWSVMDLEVKQMLDVLELYPSLHYVFGKKEKLQTLGMSLYYGAAKDPRVKKSLLGKRKKLVIDDHSFWWKCRGENLTKINQQSFGGAGENEEDDRKCKGNNNEEMADKWEKAREYLLDGIRDTNGVQKKLMEIQQKRNEDLEGYGMESEEEEMLVTAAGSTNSIDSVFGEFLRIKSITREFAEYNDRMLYQYGLSLYGNVPLIEPEEEIEDIYLDNLVIAIDTSGSCSEDLGVFLKQIIDIFQKQVKKLKFKKIFLMQCDSSIKNVQEFVSVDELEEIQNQMVMSGFGGTSFVPVFRWIEKKLLSNDEKVDCLLYFTDGDGLYPKEEPEYPVFFFLPERILGEQSIPEWIRTICL